MVASSVNWQASLALGLILATAQTAVATPVGRQAAGCTRETLTKAADLYVAAQTAGKIEPLTASLAANWTYEENNKVIDRTKGTLSKPLKIDSRRSIYDTVACASYTELIVTDPASPHVIGTQLRHTPDGASITLIDSVSSTTGAWLFNPKNTLEYTKQEKWDPIPEEKRDKREFIKAAGDAYMDLWSDKDAVNRVPWAVDAPCVRTEGGATTGGAGKPIDTCKSGIPSNSNQLPNTRRRYVIDDVYGSVNILCVWEHMMYAADSHEFRLENSKLRYIHTITTCGDKVCRL
ncbi:hypothetical protein V8F20_004835 [Naviculisporaceae sp. PSN 640]